MIRLVEDINISNLLTPEHPEVNRRYWSYSAYSGFMLHTPSTDHLSFEEEEEYLADILVGGSNLIDLRKFGKASKLLGMDEWTSVNGFVAPVSEAVEIHNFITDNDYDPEIIVSKYPDIEHIGFYWVDGWWEIFDDITKAYEMIQGTPRFVDTKSSPYINSNCDEKIYYEARKELALMEQNHK